MDSLDPVCITQLLLTLLLTWFCDFSCLFLSSFRRIKAVFRPSLLSRCHFMTAVWRLQAVPPPGPLLGWALWIPDPQRALTDVSSPSPAPRWGVTSEPEAVSCSQQYCEYVNELTKFAAWTGAGSEPRVKNLGVSVPACAKMPLALHLHS